MAPIRRATPLDLLLLFLMVGSWAGAFTAIKIAVGETGAVWLAADRVALGFVCLALASILMPRLRLSTDMPWRRLFVIAIFNVTAPFCLIAWAELHVTASLTSLLMGAGPFFALAIMHFATDDERLNGLKILAAITGFAGVLVAVGPQAVSDQGTLQILPMLAIMTASLCYIFSGLLVRKTEVDPQAMATGTLFLGTLQLIPLALLVQGPHPQVAETETLYALLFLGLLPTGMAYILRYYLIQKVGYSLVVMGINILPVAGVAIAALTLGETIPPSMYLALGLVLAGLLLARQAQTGAPASTTSSDSQVVPK
ncbi:MAG: DMT family transporter [Pseudomonadota bacterium]